MDIVEKEKREVYYRVKRLAPDIRTDETDALRRSAKTLHRWYEHECNGAIQRDENTGKAYWYNTNTGKRICRAPDREKGAERRIAAICMRHGLYYYLQTDPRGGTLYISQNPLKCDNYNSGLFVV